MASMTLQTVVVGIFDRLLQLTAQISENLGEDERLVQGLCALLLGICIYYNDNSPENYTKEKLKQLIEKRIGKENFVEKLGFIAKHELYSRAAQKPQPIFPSPEQMLFDHEFTKLVKELEGSVGGAACAGMITKAVHKSSEEEKKEQEVKKTLEQHDNIVTQYKELIREQDVQIQELKEQLSSMTSQNEQLQATMTQQISQIQQHKDQYNILKLKLGKENQSQGEGSQVNGLQTEELTLLKEEVEELRKQNVLLQTQLGEKDALINTLRSETSQVADGSAGGSDGTQLLEELEALRSQVQSQSVELSQMKTERTELLRRADAGADAKKLSESRAELGAAAGLLHQHGGHPADGECEAGQTEVAESKKEQDDLLMLLADQDQKIFSLKQRLKDLGETVRPHTHSGYTPPSSTAPSPTDLYKQVEDEDDLDAKDQTDEEEEED
ncbi:unnamed protein product, partial [Tetraodon nigroviridis]